ncbi:MAG TPA: protein kinase [Thermoanaerobaculia bacterium]|nr:protein kinase [Thermoanaerobaculia bacterium]
MPYPDYLVGEPLFEGSDLRILHASDPDSPANELAEAINRGATGVVFKVMQGEMIERAVKILLPERRILEQQSWDNFLISFEKEKKQLSQLTHSHLVKLISFGSLPLSKVVTLKNTEIPVPFIVMEYVQGKRLQDYIAEDLSGLPERQASEIVVNLLVDVLSALQYMHEKNAMHSDVKEANIVVRKTNRPEAVLVDLGAAHVFNEPRPEFTTYITTKNRLTREWQDLVLKSVPASKLAENRHILDLLTFGSMLHLFLNENLPAAKNDYEWPPRVQQALQRALGEGIVVLRRVAKKCVDAKYKSASEVAAELASMTEGYVSPLGVPELSLGTNAKTSLSLPAESLPLTERLTAIVNHPCVQRLRSLPQLDLVSLLAIGATHTRLLHSVDTYRLCRSYIGNLLGDPVFRAYCGEKHKLEATLLAGLLHDLGHYPLAHVFEDFAFRAETSGPFSGILRDEDVTCAILRNSGFVDSVVRKYLADCRSILRSSRIVSLSDFIEKEFGIEVFSYLDRILGNSPDSDEGVEILQSIISGPLDVDKVAYLHYDSYFSGSAYGKAVDVDSLLSSLTCSVVEEDPATERKRTAKLGAIAIREKGICTAEAISTARRWMFQRLYWHKTNRAIMAMLRFAPQLLLQERCLTFEQYFEAAYSVCPVEAIKWLNSKFEEHYGAYKEIENPALLILDGRRGIYKEFLEFASSDTDGDSQKIRSYLMGRSCSEWLTVAVDIAKILGQYVDNIRNSDVLVDFPAAQRHDIGDVLVIGGGAQSGRRLSEVSDEFRSARAFFEKGALSCRVFIHPEVRRQLAERNVLVRAKWAARDLLQSKAPR